MNGDKTDHEVAASNERLMTLYYEGRDTAFEQLADRLRPRLVREAYYRLPAWLSGRWQQAEDLVSVALIKALGTRGRRGSRWDPSKGRVAGWIVGILRKQVASFLRVKKGKELLSTDLGPVDPDGEPQRFEEQVADDRPGVEHLVAEREQQRDLLRAIEQLSDQEHTVLMMRYHEGQTYHQIGQHLGMSKPTAYRRVRDAVRALETIFGHADNPC